MTASEFSRRFDRILSVSLNVVLAIVGLCILAVVSGAAGRAFGS